MTSLNILFYLPLFMVTFTKLIFFFPSFFSFIYLNVLWYFNQKFMRTFSFPHLLHKILSRFFFTKWNINMIFSSIFCSRCCRVLDLVSFFLFQKFLFLVLLPFFVGDLTSKKKNSLLSLTQAKIVLMCIRLWNVNPFIQNILYRTHNLDELFRH